MNIDKNKLRDLFAEARGLYIAMLHNAIPHDKGDKKINLILLEVNKQATKIAEEHGIKHKDLTYKDLGGFL